MSNKANAWIQKLDTDLRNKVTFDIHPTDPQVDIQPTGSCEFWIRNVDLVKYKPKPTNEQPSLEKLSPLFNKFTTKDYPISFEYNDLSNIQMCPLSPQQPSTSYSPRNLLINSSLYLHRWKMPGHDDTRTPQHPSYSFSHSQADWSPYYGFLVKT